MQRTQAHGRGAGWPCGSVGLGSVRGKATQGWSRGTGSFIPSGASATWLLLLLAGVGPGARDRRGEDGASLG